MSSGRARLGAGILLALALGCAREAEAPGRGARPVRALLTHEPASLSLIGKTDLDGERIAVQLTDSLVQYDPRMELEARVAESWEWSEDGRTLTFRLRPGVRWHDGSPVTAADVAFTIEQVRDPLVESRSWAPLFDGLESTDVVDERTFRARYSRPAPDLLEGFRVPLLPRHLAEPGAALLTGSFAEHPVGCGPFRFVRRIAGEEIVLEANDDYWDGRPRIDRLVLKIYPEERTALHALVGGELDIMTVSPDLWLQARDSDRSGRLASFVYYRTSVWAIRWNEDGSNPFFTDAGVRRAMMLALDREEFIREVLGGMGRVGVTTYPPGSPWVDPDLAPLPYDPDAAAQLLDAAGWRLGPDGRRARAGRPFRFTLLVAASSQPLPDQLAAWLQQSWAEVGVSAEIEKLEWNHYRDRRDGGDYEAAMGGLSTTATPDQFEIYHSSMRASGMNSLGFADPECDRLLEEGRAVFDPARRREIYRALQRRLHELQPVGCLVHFATPVLHDARLKGIEPSPLDYWRTTGGPRSWWWDEGD